MRSASATLVVVPLLALLAACGGGPAPAPPPEKAGNDAARASAAPAPGAGSAPAMAAAPFAIDVSPAEAETWIKEHPDTTLLDVRTPAEYAAGHLEGGLLLDFESPDFADKLTSLDKAKTYLVYCQSGRRSGKAKDMMTEVGFQSVVHLDGGIEAWQSAGKSVVR